MAKHSFLVHPGWSKVIASSSSKDESIPESRQTRPTYLWESWQPFRQMNTSFIVCKEKKT